MVLNMNMLQSLDVEIRFWERLPPTSGRKMGIIGLSEILVSSSPHQQCDMWTDKHGEIQMFVSFHFEHVGKGTVYQTSAEIKLSLCTDYTTDRHNYFKVIH
jgi:hypothetical protein